jgi:hypothetical protein
MTARERLNARPGPIHPSRRRAPAHTAKVRSNSDPSPQDTPLTTQSKPAFHFAAGIRAATTVISRPCNSLTSHLAPIEIP